MTAKNRPKFLTTFDFDREHLGNGSTYQKSEKLLKIYGHSHVGWKKCVYFGPQTTKLFPLINLHPNGLLSGDYTSALRGCCAVKFLHVLEIYQGLLAHTPSGAGVPQKNCNRENLKFGLKFSLLESITSGCHCCERNFDYLNSLSTRTCDAGRPHVGLCHALLVNFRTVGGIHTTSSLYPSCLETWYNTLNEIYWFIQFHSAKTVKFMIS